jgi:hypothetical protein
MAASLISASGLATGFSAAVSISVSHSIVWCYRFSRMFVLATWERAEDFKQPARFAHSMVSRLLRSADPLPHSQVFAVSKQVLSRYIDRADMVRDRALFYTWCEGIYQQLSPFKMPMQNYWLSTVRAAIELQRHDSAKAIGILHASVPYELADPPPFSAGTMYPVYLRGEAYLAAGNGGPAAAELQKILDHPGVIVNFPLSALSHLGLGRARALSGDLAGARTAYQDFFALWKDADSDIPILKQAKAEYAKLQ